MFVIGTYYPPEKQLANLPDEYVIGPHLLATVADQLVGKPVTYEHLGINDAFSLLRGKTKLLSDTDTYKQSLDVISGRDNPLVLPIGTVCSTWQGNDGGWRCMLLLNTHLGCVYSMIQQGICSGLSLTHINAGVPAVVDVTLCASPARNGCAIEFMTSCHIDAIMYKVRSLMCMNTDGSMEGVQAAARSPLEVALEGISEDSRRLIVARFEELVKFCDTAKQDVRASKASLDNANEKFSQYQNSKQQDIQMLGYQFQQLLDRIPAEVRNQHTINKDLIDSMTSANEHIRMNSTSRLLQACNMQMMSTATPKRVKTIEFAKPAAPAEAMEDVAPQRTTEREETDDALRRALRESFEM